MTTRNKPAKNLFYETGRFTNLGEIISRIKIPKDHRSIPNIIVIAGPARGGTTALGILLANLPEISLSFFQPIKELLRYPDPILNVPDLDNDAPYVVFKETFGPIFDEELYDPIDILVQAGVPKERISVIFTLRSPFSSVASLNNIVLDDDNEPALNIDYYARMQKHSTLLFNKYSSDPEIKSVVPLVYELFAEYGDLITYQRLINSLNPDLTTPTTLEFNHDLIYGNESKGIRSKIVWGEADPQKHPGYFNKIIVPTLRVNKFTYSRGTIHHVESDTITHDEEHELLDLCSKDYFAFKYISEQTLFPDFVKKKSPSLDTDQPN
ncbi:hypothetical protein KC614_02645 [candidate division WWE3 bacterium]|uniref:Sulfotransferase domain-containing protein n=1 Tax=candidate division WWE3 bacterium TaxID=2053526 RepID=A0A955LKD4_UNCKA|nr:hypothetical protein [candidate division WWE3 bacterium]